MFLSTVKSKGNHYIYLYAYAVRDDRFRSSVSVFKFGRKEIAIKNMHHWVVNFEEFPEELLNLGCDRTHLEDWIKTLEPAKTEKQIKAII